LEPKFIYVYHDTLSIGKVGLRLPLGAKPLSDVDVNFNDTDKLLDLDK